MPGGDTVENAHAQTRLRPTRRGARRRSAGRAAARHRVGRASVRRADTSPYDPATPPAEPYQPHGSAEGITTSAYTGNMAKLIAYVAD
ncbi:hypothetical protein [Streptomyces sp. NPDC055400]